MTRADYLCEEREISPIDDTGGVARRWRVVFQPNGAMHTVVLFRADGQHYAGQPFLACDCGIERCVHLMAIREQIFAHSADTPRETGAP